MKPIDKLFDGLDWKELPHDQPSDIPIATHEGILKIGSHELRVYQLSNGMRVIEESDLIQFFCGDKQ